MSKKKIQDYSLKYDFLRYIFFNIPFKRFYHRNIITINEQRIPYDRPVIFAPNHQNALIDALVLVTKLKSQPVFLARQDVFKGGIVSWFLTVSRIMPVYRIRDGKETLSKNDEIFIRSADVLHDRKHLCLMPEGNHGDKRRLRPLVKGLFRIAFMAQEEFKAEKGVVIIPVGLDYSHYFKIRHDVIINFGEPIEVSDFYDLYVQDAPRAVNMLRDKVAEELHKQMIDIRSDEFYESTYFLHRMYPDAEKNKKAGSRKGLIEKYFRSQKIVNAMNTLAENDSAKMRDLDAKVKKYSSGLEDLKLRDWLFFKKGYGVFNLVAHALMLIILSPVTLFGWVNNYFIYWISQILIKRIKDIQFHSSVKFGLIFFVSPFYYGLMFLLFFFILKSGWMALGYVVVSMLTWLVAIACILSWKRLAGKCRYNSLRRRQDPRFVSLENTRNEIMNLMKTIV